jgi:phage-related minor tail protein
MTGKDTTFSVSFDHSGVAESFGKAAALFNERFQKPVAESTGILSSAFRRVLFDFERALTGAARTGQFSMKQMVDSILNDLSRLAFQKFVTKPVTNFIEGIFGKLLDFGGPRAAGGPVSSGRAYLVGEQGPEMFVPAGAGHIAPSAGGRPANGPIIHFNITTADAESFRRSEAQVSAMLARAVKRGTRGL